MVVGVGPGARRRDPAAYVDCGLPPQAAATTADTKATVAIRAAGEVARGGLPLQ